MINSDKEKAIDRRLKEKKGGNGYWAAMDAYKNEHGHYPKQ